MQTHTRTVFSFDGTGGAGWRCAILCGAAGLNDTQGKEFLSRCASPQQLRSFPCVTTDPLSGGPDETHTDTYQKPKMPPTKGPPQSTTGLPIVGARHAHGPSEDVHPFSLPQSSATLTYVVLAGTCTRSREGRMAAVRQRP